MAEPKKKIQYHALADLSLPSGTVVKKGEVTDLIPSSDTKWLREQGYIVREDEYDPSIHAGPDDTPEGLPSDEASDVDPAGDQIDENEQDGVPGDEEPSGTMAEAVEAVAAREAALQESMTDTNTDRQE
jgi:hypothetical protein